MHSHNRVVATLAGAFVALSLPLTGQQPQTPAGLTLDTLPHVTLTVLSDNMTMSGALAEWGWAVLVEAGERRILFDTGAGRVLAGNAKTLKVDLSRLDAIVLSHGHGDHTDGLPQALDLAGKVDVFVHPAAFDALFWRDGAKAVRVPPSLSRDELGSRVRRIVETREPTVIVPGIVATGAIPRVAGFEDTGVGGQVFTDEAMTKPSAVPEDQALIFRTPEGVVVLLGCAHAGVVNTLRYVAGLLGEPHVYAVIGGTHLLSASAQRMEKTEEAFKELGVQKIMLSHCTGLAAFTRLSNAFPGRCTWPSAGSRIEFGKAAAGPPLDR